MRRSEFGFGDAMASALLITSGFFLVFAPIAVFAMLTRRREEQKRFPSPLPPLAMGMFTGQGASDPYVKAIQILLNVLWSFQPGMSSYLKPDGILGSRTVSLIQSFQTSMNMTPDGAASADTLLSLQNAVADKLDMQSRFQAAVTP